MRKIIAVSALLAASLLGLGAPAHAQININIGPPPPRMERMPPPRHGMVWTGGHYAWRHGRYMWMPGQWIPARPGFAWRPARWAQRPNGSWFMVGGGWERPMGPNRRPFARDFDHRDRFDRGDRLERRG